ncbi:hypothetical protein H2248_009927 [Termitomyces sp. 'cryptogamus']|nr:hypothetical protein H2248_009927 [Termitomyces sp. 'cryptogamus']
MIVLNSIEAAVNLLDKPGANYSDKPRFVVYELVGWVRSITLTPYGKRFHKLKKMFQEHLELSKASTYRPIQIQEARVLLQSSLSNATSVDKALPRFTTAIIIRVASGYRIVSDDDPFGYGRGQ